MVVIGMVSRMMVTGQKLDFVQTMCARRVNRESNSNSRRHQREQVKCGNHETHFSVQYFRAIDNMNASYQLRLVRYSQRKYRGNYNYLGH